MLSEFPRAAISEYPRLGGEGGSGLKNQKWMASQFWPLEVQYSGVSRPHCLRRLREGLPSLFHSWRPKSWESLRVSLQSFSDFPEPLPSCLCLHAAFRSRCLLPLVLRTPVTLR